MLEQFLRYFLNFFGDRDALEPQGPFVQEFWDPVLLWRFTESVPGTQVYFTSRPGGFSHHPYASLNLGFHVGDNERTVIRNREMMCSILGLDPTRLTCPLQEHTAIVSVVEQVDQVGSGSMSEQSAFSPCDGLLTTMTEVPLLLHFADCVPIVITALTRDEKPAVAVVHAGRKGLMSGVIPNAVAALDRLGADKETSTAAIGPCIGACCYEVDEATAKEFEQKFGSVAVKGRMLDLQQAAEDELKGAGIRPGNIGRLELCTSCDDHFYSYRRDGVTGRHGAIAWIGSDCGQPRFKGSKNKVAKARS